MNLNSKLRKFFASPFSTPILLLIIGMLAYGFYLPWMGFYWDDWPWIFRYHQYGPAAIRAIDAEFRPLAGVVLWLGSLFAGESKLGWQIYNFVIRWLGAVTLWWALRQIWPRRKDVAPWVALLFIVYPGFTQQFVSINSSRHLFPLITFFLSWGWMGQAVQRKDWRLTILSVGSALVTMFTTEYYYGLELVRGVVIWILVTPQAGSLRHKLAATFKVWWPYLLPWIFILTWRFSISHNVNYEVTLVKQLKSSPLVALGWVGSTILRDFGTVTLGAGDKLFSWPIPKIFGPTKTLLYWVLVGAGAIITLIYTQFSPLQSKNRHWNWHAILVGTFILLVGGLPFLATDLEIKLEFPNDRLILPLILGIGLITISLLDLISWPALKAGLMATLVGLAVGVHFQNAVSYQRDWDYQAAFFEQLTLRVPGLKAGTALLSPELPLTYSTDNSLSAPLNWIYGPDTPGEQKTAIIFYLDLRLGTKIPALEPNTGIDLPGVYQDFKGSTNQAILIYHQPPGCLRVIHPEYDRYYPRMPDEVDVAVEFSNLDQISVNVDPPASLPKHIYDLNQAKGWCHYFQKADLARQQGDWAAVAKIGNQAFKLDDSPNHASERVPFIEAYARTGKWDTARDLTLEALQINRFMDTMLCETWARVAREAEVSEKGAAVIQRTQAELGCE
jgi:hypothetical protein